MVEDLVLWLKQYDHGKLESPWLGPYILTEVIPRGAYQLQDKKTNKDEGNSWNTEQLQRFYAKKLRLADIGFLAQKSEVDVFYFLEYYPSKTQNIGHRSGLLGYNYVLCLL
jgi:hypothetical protein